MQLSRDRVPVFFHDARLARTTGAAGTVAGTPWRRLRALDAGGWFSPRFQGEPVPRLAEALGAFRRRPVTWFLDVKAPRAVPVVHRVVCRMGLRRRCRLATYHPTALSAACRLTPAVPIYWVTGLLQPLTPRRVALAQRLGVAGILAYRRWVTPQAVRRVQAAGLELWVWTVRRIADERRFARLGVTGIMTERCPR